MRGTLQTLAAVLAVAATTQLYAQSRVVTVVWDGQRAEVAVDRSYRGTPSDRALQAVIAGDVRPAVRNLQTEMAVITAAINDLHAALVQLPQKAPYRPSVPAPEPTPSQDGEGKAPTPAPAPSAGGGLTRGQAKAIADKAIAEALTTMGLDPNQKLVDQLRDNLAGQAGIVTVNELKELTKGVNASNQQANLAKWMAMGACLLALIAFVVSMSALGHSRGARREVASAISEELSGRSEEPPPEQQQDFFSQDSETDRSVLLHHENGAIGSPESEPEAADELLSEAPPAEPPAEPPAG